MEPERPAVVDQHVRVDQLLDRREERRRCDIEHGTRGGPSVTGLPSTAATMATSLACGDVRSTAARPGRRSGAGSATRRARRVRPRFARCPSSTRPRTRSTSDRRHAGGQRRDLQQLGRRLGAEEVGGQEQCRRLVERLESQPLGAVPLEQGDEVGHGPRRRRGRSERIQSTGSPSSRCVRMAERRRSLPSAACDVVDAQEQRRLATRRARARWRAG